MWKSWAVVWSRRYHPSCSTTSSSTRFETVNVRDINAFALPGGPMFVNRGMIEAANNEGEVAGVMAHEISHVVLRHGTAQAGKATKYQAGQIAGAILGAIVGGGVGSAIAQGTQFGLGAAFLRYGREYEKQADLEGAQIMARAGYDPRDMANMFKTIEQTAGSERSGVAERSSQSWQPVRVHRAGSAVPARGERVERLDQVRPREGSPAIAAQGAHQPGSGPQPVEAGLDLDRSVASTDRQRRAARHPASRSTPSATSSR